MNHWPHLIVKPVHARYFVNRGHGAYEMNFGALGDIAADGVVPNDRFYREEACRSHARWCRNP